MTPETKLPQMLSFQPRDIGKKCDARVLSLCSSEKNLCLSLVHSQRVRGKHETSLAFPQSALSQPDVPGPLPIYCSSPRQKCVVGAEFRFVGPDKGGCCKIVGCRNGPGGVALGSLRSPPRGNQVRYVGSTTGPSFDNKARVFFLLVSVATLVLAATDYRGLLARGGQLACRHDASVSIAVLPTCLRIR